MALRYWRDAFLKELRATGVIRDAAASVSIDPSTVWKARKRNGEFGDEIEAAMKAHFDDRVVDC